MSWSDKIKDIRIKRKLSQQEFAERAGLSLATVRAVESGVRPLSVAVLDNLLRGVQLTLADFFESKIPVDYTNPHHQELHEKLQEILDSGDGAAVDGIEMNVRYISAALRLGYHKTDDGSKLKQTAGGGTAGDIFISSKTGRPLSEKGGRRKVNH